MEHYSAFRIGMELYSAFRIDMELYSAFRIESINMEHYSAIGVHIDIRPYRTNKAGNWFLLRLC